MNVIHKPSRPVRTDVIGEVVFMSNWHDLTRRTVLNGDSQVSFLRHLLKPIIYTARNDVTQREAMVAASFVKWLGTGCGSCFLSEMLEIKKKALRVDEKEAFAEFWVKKNVIDPRSGYRLIQNIIAKEDDYVSGALPGLSQLGRYVMYTAHDVDVIECVCRFLGTEEGMGFAQSCTLDIQDHWAQKIASPCRFSLPQISA